MDAERLLHLKHLEEKLLKAVRSSNLANVKSLLRHLEQTSRSAPDACPREELSEACRGDIDEDHSRTDMHHESKDFRRDRGKKPLGLHCKPESISDGFDGFPLDDKNQQTPKCSQTPVSGKGQESKCDENTEPKPDQSHDSTLDQWQEALSKDSQKLKSGQSKESKPEGCQTSILDKPHESKHEEGQKSKSDPNQESARENRQESTSEEYQQLESVPSKESKPVESHETNKCEESKILKSKESDNSKQGHDVHYEFAPGCDRSTKPTTLLDEHCVIQQKTQPSLETMRSENPRQTILNKALFLCSGKAMAKLLISHGANMATRDEDGNTVMMVQVRERHVDVVKYLLGQGADIDVVNHDGESALHVSIQSRDFKLFQLLIEKGAKTDTVTNDGETALHYAARLGYLRFAEVLLVKGADIKAQNASGNTPLHLGAENGRIEVVGSFLAHSADVNIQNKNGETPLHLAVSAEGFVKIVTMLLQSGSNVDLQNETGDTALMKAMEHKHLDMAAALTRAGANWDIANAQRDSAISIAADKELNGLISVLSQPNVETFRAHTIRDLVLIAASLLKHEALGILFKSPNLERSGDHALATLALQHTVIAIYRYSDHQLSSALPLFSEGNHILRKVIEITDRGRSEAGENMIEDGLQTVLFLLSHGASVNTINKMSSAFMVAVCSGVPCLVRLLCEHGANVTAKCFLSGKMPLLLAAEKNRTDLVAIMLPYCSADEVKMETLCTFIRHRHYDTAKEFWISCLPRSLDVYTSTLCDVVFLRNNYEIVQLLLDQKPKQTREFFSSVRGRDYFCQACNNANGDVVQLLIKHGADVNGRDANGMTPLMQCGKGPVAAVLIENGAEVNARFAPTKKLPRPSSTAYRPSAVTFAAERFASSVVEVLIQSSAVVRNEDLVRAFGEFHYDVKCVELLVLAGCDVNTKLRNGNTLLYQLLRDSYNRISHTQSITDLIELVFRHGAVYYHSMFPFSPMNKAVEMCNLRMLRLLVQHGASVNERDEYTGNTPLLTAVSRRCVGVSSIKVLLDLGADISLTNAHSNKTMGTLLLESRTEEIYCYGCSHDKAIPALVLLLDAGAGDDIGRLVPKYLLRALGTMEMDLAESLTKMCLPFIGPWQIHVDINSNLLHSDHKPSKSMRDLFTPFSFALYNSKYKLAQYFVDKLFLTPSDMFQLPRNEAWLELFNERGDYSSLELLGSLCSTVPSLFQLSFIAVSMALGPRADRQKRVKVIGLPLSMQRRLIFQEETTKPSRSTSLVGKRTSALF